MLGHELGHVVSGHALLYKTMLGLLIELSIVRLGLPFTQLTLITLIMALREWDRTSELSADRAGLLCVQVPEAGYRAHMKMAGGTRVDEMNLEAFKTQARTTRQRAPSPTPSSRSSTAASPHIRSRSADSPRLCASSKGATTHRSSPVPIRRWTTPTTTRSAPMSGRPSPPTGRASPSRRTLSPRSCRTGLTGLPTPPPRPRTDSDVRRPVTHLEDYAWTGFDDDLFEE